MAFKENLTNDFKVIDRFLRDFDRERHRYFRADANADQFLLREDIIQTICADDSVASNAKCFRQQLTVDNAGRIEQIKQQFRLDKSVDVLSISDSVDVVSLSESDVYERLASELIQRALLLFDIVINLDDFMMN